MSVVFFENKYIKFWKEQDIVFGQYKNNVIISLEAAYEIVEYRKTHFPDKYYWLLYIEDFEYITPQARAYFASDYSNTNVIKWAFILNKPFSILLSNLFIFINKPKVPVKLFSDTESAIKWLKG